MVVTIGMIVYDDELFNNVGGILIMHLGGANMNVWGKSIYWRVVIKFLVACLFSAYDDWEMFSP